MVVVVLQKRTVQQLIANSTTEYLSQGALQYNSQSFNHELLYANHHYGQARLEEQSSSKESLI